MVMVLFVVLSACSHTGNVILETSPVKIGVAAPLTGPIAEIGGFYRDAAELAAAEINADGGINGRPVQLVYGDTQCPDNVQALNTFKKLHEIDQVEAIVGPFSGTANRIAGDYSQQTGALFVSSGDNFGKLSPRMVHTRYLIDDEAQLLADYAVAQGWRRMGILYYNNDWGESYRLAMETKLREVGGELVVSESYTHGNLDVRTQLLKIKEAEPDAAIIIDGAGGELFTQAAEIGLDIPLLSEWEVAKRDARMSAGTALNGVRLFLPITEETAFKSAFEVRYDEEPNTIHIDTYDALMLLRDGMEFCGVDDKTCIVDYMTSQKDYAGAGGPMTFDKGRWAFKKPFRLVTIMDGEVVDQP